MYGCDLYLFVDIVRCLISGRVVWFVWLADMVSHDSTLRYGATPLRPGRVPTVNIGSTTGDRPRREKRTCCPWAVRNELHMYGVASSDDGIS